MMKFFFKYKQTQDEEYQDDFRFQTYLVALLQDKAAHSSAAQSALCLFLSVSRGTGGFKLYCQFRYKLW